MNATGWAAGFLRSFQDDPLTFAAIVAAMFAMATTPIAFAVLGRIDWFKARRGRVLQKPEFASIVAAMILAVSGEREESRPLMDCRRSRRMRISSRAMCRRSSLNLRFTSIRRVA